MGERDGDGEVRGVDGERDGEVRGVDEERTWEVVGKGAG